MLYSFLKPIAVFLFKLLFRLEIYGKDYIPKEGGFILASNHVSYLDPIVLGVACSRRLNFMAKEELFENPVFSRFISLLGAFPVKRDSADLSAIKEAMRRLKKGMVLVLFPEGSRRFDGYKLKPYSGIGFLSAKLNVPVVPVFIHGTDRALPKNAKFIRLTKISLHFGKKISFGKDMPYPEIARIVMERINQLAY
ncbi:MAG: 1-acyl-sn-glycerol-3-phosphate acyltransferase [Candidatus Omnitrophica bacterium]|nr:1-acyl-sn-glycerol-3-phosphate acyltransferase [Candidatus Omnitrophota bacterium]